MYSDLGTMRRAYVQERKSKEGVGGHGLVTCSPGADECNMGDEGESGCRKGGARKGG